MGICSVRHPDEVTTFVFEWITESDDVKLTAMDDAGTLATEYNLTKAKARITWDNFQRAGYRLCRA